MEKPLKLIFLVGCLESGQDGVGDYIRTFAQGLCKRGHRCLLIALKDPFIGYKPVFSLDPSAPIACLRMDDVYKHRSYFKKQVESFCPDFLSLQFVPYAFQKKGFPLYLASLLKPLAKQYPFHFMMHELWIGFESSSSLKHKVLGYFQKLCIHYLLTTLKPKVLHTHSHVYQKQLSSIYPKVGILPLFSSIQKQNLAPFRKSLETILNDKDCKISLKNKPSQTPSLLIFSLFGTLHPQWPPEPFLSTLFRLATLHKKTILILHFGNIGSGEALWKQMVDRYLGKITFCKLGQLSPEEIGIILEHTHYGVAASPLHLLEKSATALSFLEWGCPLIVNRIEKEVDLPSFFEERILKINTPQSEKDLLHRPHFPYISRLESACFQFLKDIQPFIR